MVSEQELVTEDEITDEGIPVEMHSDPTSSIPAAASSVRRRASPCLAGSSFSLPYFKYQS